MLYTCDTCHCPVSLDEGFFRSVNLRTVAWCRDCWLARHTELGIPGQRQGSDPQPAQGSQRSPRGRARWLSRR
jgi:hypothetical protein